MHLWSAIVVTVLTASILASAQGAPPTPVAWWTFDSAQALARAAAAGDADSLSGHHSLTPGVSGQALKLDGYTTVVRRKADAAPRVGEAFTIEAWVALGAYPWNHAPLVDQSDTQLRGYSFTIGPRGELALKVAAEGRWLEATSAPFLLPLRTWTHVAARYHRAEGLSLFVNGKPAGAVRPHPLPERGGRAVTGLVTRADDLDLLIGAVREPVRPSNWHRFEGNQPTWFSLDAILDELKIYDSALAEAEIARAASAVTPPAGETHPLRKMPAGPPGPGRFGAHYADLAYYPEWDALWRVGPDPDVVVRFDTSPVRVVFWRGTQYGPAWVTGDLWMADQSVEGYDRGHTWEHMNDKQNRYSHVRIIEQHDARAVVHWRYALVNVKNQFWNVTERLGNGAWIDEYYYFYPDATGVRKVTWERGTLGRPVQFQESIVLTQPGQLQGDVINPDYATVGNLAGETQVLSYVENPPAQSAKKFPPDLTVQMHNFKSDQKPFVIFEPGNKMGYLRDMDIRALSRAGSGNHWPEGQTLSDGRTSQAADRPSHFLGFPISNPPIHEGPGGRDYWNGLYGMSNAGFPALVELARSWSTPAGLTIQSGPFISNGFDRSERAWRIARRKGSGSQAVTLTFAASATSPIRNVALVVEGWGDTGAALHVDGRTVARGQGFRYGHRHRLDGTDLIVWVDVVSDRAVTLQLSPQR
jgi:hypothetical protein